MHRDVLASCSNVPCVSNNMQARRLHHKRHKPGVNYPLRCDVRSRRKEFHTDSADLADFHRSDPRRPAKSAFVRVEFFSARKAGTQYNNAEHMVDIMNKSMLRLAGAVAVLFLGTSGFADPPEIVPVEG